ncbi:hypothetical protein TSUD_79100 [Trifolium subterraneum]|uniref:TIR domain-containing protein n=1 Tax=Trifolium subterraneum TaxID=3900 RepID=A0A2Z6M9V0_TRISU|nr:hypothetical protein TSUD_79100 [Trifolium subterraneum]
MSHPTTLKYDVFLSFRGEDTRENFTSHLYKDLCRKNIETFIDYRIESGDEVSPALNNAIENSTIYVVILSEHYASSRWCLDELKKILDCRQRHGREVIPVFYKVDPSDVRHQRGSYEKDIIEQHKRFGNKVDAWKAALTQVANLSGLDSRKFRKKVQEGMLRLLPIATQDQLVDCFTKALLAPKFHLLIKFGLLDIYQACGRMLTDEVTCDISNNNERDNHPKESFVSLTKKVLDYAKGLPLALKVLGLLLYGKTKEVWESQLQKLKKLPDLKIFSLLKLSYDELDEEQKDIFLDIVCFYRGELEKVVEQMLDCCGFSACKGMDDLKDRGLISISKYGTVWMHDLIQEMGHEIVRLQDKDGKRSRLWKSNDIYDCLCKNKGKGTEEIQCIFLDMEEMMKIKKVETFKKMHKLRMINFYTQTAKLIYTSTRLIESPVTFYTSLDSFPDHLKFLCWDAFPQRSLPQDFCPENLVILDMRYSKLEQLWEGDQALPKLKRLNLSHSKKLVRVPDLSLSPNIEEVILHRCESLIEVYSSAFLDNLNWLWLGHCSKLERLDIRSNILWRSSGLVNLDGCYKLETLLISGRTDVVQTYIYSDNCVYSDLGGYRFDWPEMSICSKNDEGDHEILEGDYEIFEGEEKTVVVTSFNELCWLHIARCKSLTCLPAELFNFKFLRRLCLNGCSKLEVLPEFEETMENLKVLLLEFTAIKELPSSLHHLVGLEKLSLRGCTKLKTIPSSIGNLSKLLELELSYCESLETFPSSIFKLKLTELDFEGCKMLGTFPEIPNEFGRLSSLIELSLQGSSIVNLPESMAHLSSLRSLNISGCKLLECVPKLPPNLKEVLAFKWRSIKRMMLNSGSDSKEGTFKLYLTKRKELDATSLSNIEKEAYIKINNDAYSSVLFCFPGSAVPDWFPHRCQGHSITIRSDDLYLYQRNRFIGFALCVVLQRDFPLDISWDDSRFAYALKFEYDGHTNNLQIKCDWEDRRFTQDHTFLWKYELGNRHIHAPTITFEILDVHGSPLSFPATKTVKECGVCPLYTKQNDDDDDDDEGNNEEPSGDAVCLLDLDLSLGGNYTQNKRRKK